MKTFQIIVSTLLIGSGLAPATHALAAEAAAYGARDVPSRTISIRDLDLAEPSHLPILYARVQQSASAVCDDTVRAERRLHRRLPAGWRDQCVRSAVDEAVRRVKDQRLTALHRRKPELLADGK